MHYSQMLKLAALVALVPAAAQAQAPSQAKWKTIHASGDLRVAVDMASIVANPDGSRTVWTRWDYSRARILESKKSYTRLVEKAQLKCAPVVMKRVNTALYDRAGRMVKAPEELASSEVMAMTWDAPKKGTEGARVWASVCRTLNGPKKK